MQCEYSIDRTCTEDSEFTVGRVTAAMVPGIFYYPSHFSPFLKLSFIVMINSFEQFSIS